jgi:CubicO group peptidase (beta-lactamase class C family)
VRARRWLVAGVVVVAVVAAAALGFYGWARLSTDDSTLARAVIWGESDVGDQDRFPSRPIPAGAGASRLPTGPESELPLDDEFLRRSDTLAFVVVHKDRIVRERYFEETTRESLLTSFSVAKSFVSTLVGIAIDEGLIDSVEDPVTEYVPELAERNLEFVEITLRDLLAMSSGIRYDEGGFPSLGDDTHTYYGTDLRDLALNGTEVEQPAGITWHYNNYNPLLLGLVLERATGMSVSEFMSARLWRPLGAQAAATWSLDSKGSGFEKLESGVNATARDYARFGLLFLNEGEWNGRRIVSKEWVRAATAADRTTDPAYHYQYFWWIDVERSGRFYAFGKYGQYIYVAPDADVVIVRLGRDWGVGNNTWLARFRDVADQLAG